MKYIRFYNPYFNAYRDENTRANIPQANIYEAGKEYRIEMALPGVDKKDINISFENGLLKVSVEKEQEMEDTNRYDRHEFNYRGTERTFKTGETVDGDHISAKHENGVLTLILPKKEAYVKKPMKSIEIA
ncbi:MAG TPA: Hsp20/alpha crystallin family protein [Bacteroidales bacterium]|jgi:HSP20 family protein|nr:Hsp20/alpha crystallin family protein [Bacteroidales bacterium]